jgi:hypothetical protein
MKEGFIRMTKSDGRAMSKEGSELKNETRLEPGTVRNSSEVERTKP